MATQRKDDEEHGLTNNHCEAKIMKVEAIVKVYTLVSSLGPSCTTARRALGWGSVRIPSSLLALLDGDLHLFSGGDNVLELWIFRV